LGIDRRFTVMYAGVFGRYQQLTVLLEAARALRTRDDIGFALVGGGVDESRLRALVEREALDNVTFVPLQPFEAMADVLALGDLQLVSLQDLPLFQSTLPSKVQATMAAGRPILGAVTGDAADVVRSSGAGPVVTPGSVVEMAEAILSVAGMTDAERSGLGARGREFYLSRFSEDVVSRRMQELLERAASQGRRR
jgi:glycosyltransferase involved in cell wall biosynthesis